MDGKDLKLIYKKSGITSIEFANRIGVSKAQLYVLFKSLSVPKDVVSIVENYNKNEDKKSIPVYDVDVSASNINSYDDFGENIIGHISMEGFNRCIAFVRVKGLSMAPDFMPGDLIGAEPLNDFTILEYGQPFIIITKSMQRFLKIIRKGDSNENLILRSVNSELYDDIDIKRSEIEFVYKACGPIRNRHN